MSKRHKEKTKKINNAHKESNRTSNENNEAHNESNEAHLEINSIEAKDNSKKKLEKSSDNHQDHNHNHNHNHDCDHDHSHEQNDLHHSHSDSHNNTIDDDGLEDPNTLDMNSSIKINSILTTKLDYDSLKSALEAILFAASKPLTEENLLSTFLEENRPSKPDLKKALKELKEFYQGRGVTLAEVASGYRFQINPKWGPFVSKLWEEKAPRYSRALLETLALIAYRQPITRGEIEDVRGVTVSPSILKTIEERNWVRIVGHKEVPGRPALYATTKEFLDYFGLKSLEDLPALPHIMNMEEVKDPNQEGGNAAGSDNLNSGKMEQLEFIDSMDQVIVMKEGAEEITEGAEENSEESVTDEAEIIEDAISEDEMTEEEITHLTEF